MLALVGAGAGIFVVTAAVAFLCLFVALDDDGEFKLTGREGVTTRPRRALAAAVVVGVGCALSGFAMQQTLQDQAANQKVRVATTAKYGVPAGHDQEIPNVNAVSYLPARLQGDLAICQLNVSGGEPFVLCGDKYDREADRAGDSR